MHKECATMQPHERCAECGPAMQADETLRPEFEAWLNPGRHDGNVSAWVAPGRYEKESHQLAFLAWQAARSKAPDDAARYRWLRDKSEPGICAFYLSVGLAFKGVKFVPKTVDDAIDAARAEQISLT